MVRASAALSQAAEWKAQSRADREAAQKQAAQGPCFVDSETPRALRGEYPPTAYREGAAIWVGFVQQGHLPTFARWARSAPIPDLWARNMSAAFASVEQKFDRLVRHV